MHRVGPNSPFNLGKVRGTISVGSSESFHKLSHLENTLNNLPIRSKILGNRKFHRVRNNRRIRPESLMSEFVCKLGGRLITEWHIHNMRQLFVTCEEWSRWRGGHWTLRFPFCALNVLVVVGTDGRRRLTLVTIYMIFYEILSIKRTWLFDWSQRNILNMLMCRYTNINGTDEYKLWGVFLEMKRLLWIDGRVHENYSYNPTKVCRYLV